MYDILLIFPKIDGHGGSDYIPLSIMKVGGYYESQGKRVAYWDERCDSIKELISLAKQSKIVGFSCMNESQYNNADDLIIRIWHGTHHKVFIIGGNFAQNQKDDLIDYLWYSNTDGTNTRCGRIVYGTKKRCDLQNPITESTKRFYRIFQPQLFTSFGCLFRCSFCVVNSKWTPIPLKQIETEIKYIASLGHKFVVVNDPNIAGNLRHLKWVCYLMRKYHMTWHCNLRADAFQLTRETINMLKQGGCVSIEIGAESGSERLLQMIHKGKHYLPQLALAAMQLKHSHISCMYSFIVGLPTETIDDIKKTMRIIDMFHKYDEKARFSMYSYVPYPSKLAEQFPNTPIHNWDMAWHPLYWICGLKFRKDNLRKNFPSWKRIIALPFELLAEVSWRIRQIYWFPKRIFEFLLKVIKK